MFGVSRSRESKEIFLNFTIQTKGWNNLRENVKDIGEHIQDTQYPSKRKLGKMESRNKSKKLIELFYWYWNETEYANGLVSAKMMNKNSFSHKHISMKFFYTRIKTRI